MSTYQTTVTKDVTNKQIRINRVFEAPVESVWQAHTDSQILDKWWAPKPWKAETKSMDFKVGGYWLYAMVGPQGEKHWARVDYTFIDKPKKIESLDSFCDENGKKSPDFASSEWSVTFTGTGSGTNVDTVLTFASEADMNKLLEMGFEEGMKAVIENLVELLKNR